MFTSTTSRVRAALSPLFFTVGLLIWIPVSAGVLCGPPLVDVRVEPRWQTFPELGSITYQENGLNIRVEVFNNAGTPPYGDWHFKWYMIAPDDAETRFTITEFGDPFVAEVILPSGGANGVWQASGRTEPFFYKTESDGGEGAPPNVPVKFGETSFTFGWYYPPQDASGECRVTIRVIDAATDDVSLPIVLELNDSTFNTGDEVEFTASGTPQLDSPELVDVFIFLRMPNGALIFLKADGEFSTEQAAYVTSFPLAEFKDFPIYTHKFVGFEPVGEYEWVVVFTEAGTNNVANNGFGGDTVKFTYSGNSE